VLQAPNRFAAADVDVLHLRRGHLDDAVALLEELREIVGLVPILLPNSDEVLRHQAVAEEIVEGALQVGLLPNRKRARRPQHFMRPQRRKMSREALEDVAVGGLVLRALGLRRATEQRGAGVDARAADES